MSDEQNSGAPAADQRNGGPQNGGQRNGDQQNNQPKGDTADKPADKPKPGSKRRAFLIFGAVVLVLAIGAFIYWFLTRNETDTDDAYTNGRAVTIATQVSGYVTILAVNDNQFVHQGDLLVQVDPRPYQAARDQAYANLLIAKAQAQAARLGSEIARKNFPAQLNQAEGMAEQARGALFEAQAEFKRQHKVAAAATTQQAIDDSTAQMEEAEGRLQQAEAQIAAATPVPQNIGQTDQRTKQLDAQVMQAQAQLDQADLNLGYTHIVAPQDGWITRRNVETGDYLQPGGQIIALVTPDIWVTANFKETQLNRMRHGQRVDITVDAYPGLHLEGHVDSVQHGSGSRFTAFPAENATGNFVKIVQRVPVKVVIDRGLDPNRPLALGLSVIPTVYFK